MGLFLVDFIRHVSVIRHILSIGEISGREMAVFFAMMRMSDDFVRLMVVFTI